MRGDCFISRTWSLKYTITRESDNNIELLFEAKRFHYSSNVGMYEYICSFMGNLGLNLPVSYLHEILHTLRIISSSNTKYVG